MLSALRSVCVLSILILGTNIYDKVLLLTPQSQGVISSHVDGVVFCSQVIERKKVRFHIWRCREIREIREIRDGPLPHSEDVW